MSGKTGSDSASKRPGVDPTANDEVEQLRQRVKELERQLQSRPTAPKSSGGSRDGLKVVTASLAATTVLFAPPAFFTVRRWWRWWQQ